MKPMKQSTSKLRDPSRLPGGYRSRVFIGGSYHPHHRPLLEVFAQEVRKSGLTPILADSYGMEMGDIHDVTLFLLHSCRYAVFEASTLSGAYMEMERVRDYGTRALVLYNDNGGGYLPSKMLDSLVRNREPEFCIRAYSLTDEVRTHIRQWLAAMKRSPT